MALPDIDRVALCHHLADRFPEFHERARLAREAGLPDATLTGQPLAAWTAIVNEGDSTDVIGRLLHFAAALRPDDAVLVEMARSAAEGAIRVPAADDPKVWLRNTAIAGGIVVLLGVGAIVGDLVLDRADVVPSEPAVSAVHVTPTPANAATPPEAVPPEPRPVVTPDAGVPSDAAVAVPDAAVPSDVAATLDALKVPDAAVAVPDAAVATADRTPHEPVIDAVHGRASSASGEPCAGPAGVVQGYAYAGRDRPQGSTWVLPRSLNVRQDYPRRENGYNARATVTCILRKGARVDLVKEPIAVDGGAWWVPIAAGSIRTEP